MADISTRSLRSVTTGPYTGTFKKRLVANECKEGSTNFASNFEENQNYHTDSPTCSGKVYRIWVICNTCSINLSIPLMLRLPFLEGKS